MVTKLALKMSIVHPSVSLYQPSASGQGHQGFKVLTLAST